MKAMLTATMLLCTALTFAQSKEQVIGCWKMGTSGNEYIQLNRSGDFYFSDYNSKTKQYEYLGGKWQMTGQKLTLLYEDRPKQTFTLSRNSSGKWQMTKAGGFVFVKAQPSDCSEAGPADGGGD